MRSDLPPLLLDVMELDAVQSLREQSTEATDGCEADGGGFVAGGPAAVDRVTTAPIVTGANTRRRIDGLGEASRMAMSRASERRGREYYRRFAYMHFDTAIPERVARPSR